MGGAGSRAASIPEVGMLRTMGWRSRQPCPRCNCKDGSRKRKQQRYHSIRFILPQKTKILPFLVRTFVPFLSRAPQEEPGLPEAHGFAGQGVLGLGAEGRCRVHIGSLEHAFGCIGFGLLKHFVGKLRLMAASVKRPCAPCWPHMCRPYTLLHAGGHRNRN